MRQLPTHINIERELFDDRCRLTVYYRGVATRARPDVYTDLTWKECRDLLEGIGFTPKELGELD